MDTRQELGSQAGAAEKTRKGTVKSQAPKPDRHWFLEEERLYSLFLLKEDAQSEVPACSETCSAGECWQTSPGP